MSHCMTIYQDIAGLIEQALQARLIADEDEIYVRNQVLNHLHLKSYPERVGEATEDSIPNILDKLVAYAICENIIEDVFDDKEMLAANIMNCFVARPSTVNEIFYGKYKQSPEAATEYFYRLSQNSNYIQTNRIKKNIHYKTESAYGEFDITINLSKPEKDPEQIKREREIKTNIHYPKCLLCVENEGYTGRTGHPARANHRIIKVPLFEENWYLQYSPYVYYNEHSILLAEEHRDMKISKQTFERLIAFTDKFPHYFIGSNADLPIVGGSILSHDHYQAGRYEFAIDRAKSAFTFGIERFKEVRAQALKWPVSIIRLQSKDKMELVEAADCIFQKWQVYHDEEVDIHALTDDTPHNTITPIARIRDGVYELDLALRNNRTSEEHPLGVFHPHEDVHHIKKENIGLIEVMGLAVLPARLKDELEEVIEFLLGKGNQVADYHQEWANEIKEKHGPQSEREVATELIQKELGDKFARVLEDAGVFKQTVEGLAAFKRFTDSLN